MKRFFLAHSKSDAEDTIAQQKKVAIAALSVVSRGESFEVVTGREQFEARFKACGSWDAWAAEVARGVDHITRHPIFSGFMVPHVRVGAGTARIVEYALGVRKPVFVFRGDSSVARVIAVRCLDSKNFVDGWQLTVGQFMRRES